VLASRTLWQMLMRGWYGDVEPLRTFIRVWWTVISKTHAFCGLSHAQQQV